MREARQVNNSPAIPSTSGGFGAIQAATMNWVNNTQFYSIVDPYYWSFYNQWVRNWLAWYDGYVPQIHDGGNGLLSSKIGTTIVNRAADTVVGGGIMFQSANEPKEREEDGTPKALKFITCTFDKSTHVVTVLKRAIRNAFAGGTSLLKLNATQDGDLWLESLRMDRFFATVDFRGCVLTSKSFIASYNDMNPAGETVGAFHIVEERYFRFCEGKQIPTIEYKVYRSGGQVNMNTISTGQSESLSWSSIPKRIAQAIKKDYAAIRFGEPQTLPFSDSLGCELVKASDGISNLPQLQFGESILANAMPYLYLYDYYISAMSGDMYIGRGRIMLPKPMQRANGGVAPNNGHAGWSSNYNSGLDSFVYTLIETLSTDDQKPVPIQFDLRAVDWREIRNNLLESIATAVGLSVGTLASYLNDTSNRTAREVSAEESATTLFVEEKRRLLEDPINRLLETVTAYYGFTDRVEVRWSKSGFTNPQVQAQTLSLAVQSGLMSKKKAHRLFNVDEDQEQVEADWAEVEKDMQREQNSVFGDFALNAGDVM